MIFRSILIFICALILLVAVGESSATTVRKLDLKDMVKKADIVVLAAPVKASVKKQRGTVFTFTLLKVNDVIIGPKDLKEVVVRQLGGKVGTHQVVVSGEPHLKHGREALLFLHKTDGGAYYIVGFHQGSMRLTSDKHTGKKIVKEPVSKSIKTRGIYLDSFLKKVKAIKANQLNKNKKVEK